MLVGILVISSLFLIPLEEHWWGVDKYPVRLRKFRINIQSYADELELAGLEDETLILSYPQHVLESSNMTNFIACPYKPEKLPIEYSPIAS
jgi:hypothetical protein